MQCNGNKTEGRNMEVTEGVRGGEEQQREIRTCIYQGCQKKGRPSWITDRSLWTIQLNMI